MGCVYAEGEGRQNSCAQACQFCGAKIAVEKSFAEKTDIPPFETLIETRDRGRVYLKITVTYLQMPPGEAFQDVGDVAIVTVDDMTVYRQKERLGAVLETVGTICHQMNQPLMVLAGQLDLLELDIGEMPRIEKLRAQVDRMGSITRKLQSIRHYATKPYPGGTRRILDTESARA